MKKGKDMKNGYYKYPDGSKHWYLNDQHHRENGPAIEHKSGQQHWYLNGKRHCEIGPACIYPDGTKEWYLNDIEVTDKDFNQWLDKRNLHDKLQSILIEKPIEKKSKI